MEPTNEVVCCLSAGRINQPRPFQDCGAYYGEISPPPILLETGLTKCPFISVNMSLVVALPMDEQPGRCKLSWLAFDIHVFVRS